MVLAFDFRASMLAFLTDPMNGRYPHLTDGEKITTGKLVRQVAEEMGFHHDRYHVRINTPGCQFDRGSTYTGELLAAQIAA